MGAVTSQQWMALGFALEMSEVLGQLLCRESRILTLTLTLAVIPNPNHGPSPSPSPSPIPCPIHDPSTKYCSTKYTSIARATTAASACTGTQVPNLLVSWIFRG